ncbi:large ribosomal subunit protein uL24-like isoform X2 [Zophobas morio]|uniref:large ribosomal subunit protein uL24-like isoform X2 n=1 Tax=Zophobas morio TaxID=2755281 RepID=UPI003083CEDC
MVYKFKPLKIPLLPWLKRHRKMREAVIPRESWKLSVGDEVEVIQGPYLGKRGKIIENIYNENKVRVKGVSLTVRRIPAAGGNPGGLFENERPIRYSDVALIHPIKNVPVRVRLIVDKKKDIRTRATLDTGHEIPFPKIVEKKLDKIQAGPKDTPAAVVLEKTYIPSLVKPDHQILFSLGLDIEGKPFRNLNKEDSRRKI